MSEVKKFTKEQYKTFLLNIGINEEEAEEIADNAIKKRR